ncbi:MAG: MBL fold metallo-hydrolase [Rhodovulum sp.]|jgi:glyoxylase-like metal-dependent hydrolase (beta-lactamase superfamily II)|nr:MBL fold metallo-hydrolase [Rhodovulum sp.]MCI5085687.1 MBL fold metallo-hydrolase [Rhodovulum sp.]
MIPPAPIRDIHPGVRCVLAPNPSPMTYTGTNTYLVGTDRVAVIDPGPDDDTHLAAILGATADGAQITHVILTHSHLDHSALARRLADQVGAPIYAFGDSHAGRRSDLDGIDGLGGGEGVDWSFIPDITLCDGEEIATADWRLSAIHTPGHMGNHTSLAMGNLLFSGDHVMGWATSMVSPPDGDLRAFMDSLRKLQNRGFTRFLPAHGDPVENPEARLKELLDHRQMRTDQIRTALAEQADTPMGLTKRIYADVDPRLHGAALRNVMAHLIDLMDRNQITAAPALSLQAIFSPR